jgi:HD superfamily phosphohydrolase YqeK
MNNNFGEEMLAALREKMKNEMGEKRYNHTLEVEKMAARLGEIYAPDTI